MSTHFFRLAALPLAATLALASPAAANKLIRAGERVEVAKSALSVTPAIDWNRLDLRPGKSAERWTLDGERLNDVVFYAIEDDEPLVREVDRRDRPLPRFRSDMLLIDLPNLLESTHRIASNASIFSVTDSQPMKLGAASGIRFSYEFVGADELARKGIAAAAIVDGKLYMAAYEAPVIHYFDKDVAQFEQLLTTMDIGE